MRVEPYLYFNGHCEEALTFYRDAIGAELVMLSRVGNNPGAQAAEGAENLVMHAIVRIGDSTILASDGQRRGATSFDGFSLSLTTASDDLAERKFGALSDGGNVQVPMMSTPFASRFGMVTDRFGVLWTIASQT